MTNSGTVLTAGGSGVMVVGGSMAGLHAAEALREHGYDGTITVLDSAATPVCDRPPLSKQVLTGEWQPEQATLREPATLQVAGIDLRTGVRATGVDTRRRRLNTTDGSYTYSGLVIATGSAARPLPGVADRAGLHTLRTLDDCLALRTELIAGARLVVVGAGFVGMETAAAARALGAEVTVVDPLLVPLQAALGPQVGAALRRLHVGHGVSFRLGLGVRGILGTDRVEGVMLEDGSVLAAEAVLIGIGAAPAVGWLTDSGMDISAGLVCDEFLAPGPDGVVAAGDLVNWPNPLFGTRMRIEHWTNASEQGAAAAANLLAAPAARTAFSSVPYFWSDQYDVRIQSAGRASDQVDTLLADPAGPTYLTLSGTAGVLTGVLSVNTAKAFVRARRMVAARRPLAAAIEELSGLLDTLSGHARRRTS